MRRVKAVCGLDPTHNRFVVKVHLEADWIVNDVGECVEDLSWTKEVIKGPEAVAEWRCYTCGGFATLSESA